MDDVKTKLLLVDDDPIFLRIATINLTDHDFDIVTASSGSAAIERLQKDRFDVMVSDIMMPGMDGIELLKRARKSQNDLVCVMVTCMDEVKSCVQAMKAGAINYLIKPIDFEELVLTVNMGVERKRLTEKLTIQQEELDMANHLLMEEIEANRETNERLKSELAKRKRIERHLKDAQDQLNLILDSMTEGIVFIARDLTIGWLNNQACRFFGTSKEKAVSKKCHEAWYNRSERCSECIADHEDEPDSWERHESFDDGERSVRILGTIVRDASGEVLGYLKTINDVTEEERLKKEAKIRRDQLYQAEKMVSLGVLVSGVAHEINNPNNYLMLNADLLETVWRDLAPLLETSFAKKNVKVAEMTFDELLAAMPNIIEGLTEGSRRIKYIVRELKDYARDVPVTMTDDVNVSEVIESALMLMKNPIKNSTRHFHQNLHPVPLVRGDSQRLQQVLMNLLQNACQALDGPERSISLTTRHDKERGEVLIEVRDQGGGIAPDDLKRVRDPFFTTKRDQGGMGLGLSVSDSIVRDHGGRLEFVSTVSQGTTATIALPVE